MGGGKRRALKKLLNKQQNSESPSPYDTPISSEPLDIDAILAGDDSTSAPPSPEQAKAKTIPVPPSPQSTTNGAAVPGGNASPAPSQASAPAALGGGGMYGSGHGIFGGQQGGRGGKKSSKQRFAERQVSLRGPRIFTSWKEDWGRYLGAARRCAQHSRSGAADRRAIVRRQHVWIDLARCRRSPIVLEGHPHVGTVSRRRKACAQTAQQSP